MTAAVLEPHAGGGDVLRAWLTAYEQLKPVVSGLKLIAPRVAREAAHLQDAAAARRLCDDVMQSLGFEKARLGRVEFYVRKEIREQRHAWPSGTETGGNRAARRARQ